MFTIHAVISKAPTSDVYNTHLFPRAIKNFGLFVGITNLLEDCGLSCIGSAQNKYSKAFKPLSKCIVTLNDIRGKRLNGCRHGGL